MNKALWSKEECIVLSKQCELGWEEGDERDPMLPKRDLFRITGARYCLPPTPTVTTHPHAAHESDPAIASSQMGRLRVPQETERQTQAP